MFLDTGYYELFDSTLKSFCLYIDEYPILTIKSTLTFFVYHLSFDLEFFLITYLQFYLVSKL